MYRQEKDIPTNRGDNPEPADYPASPTTGLPEIDQEESQPGTTIVMGDVIRRNVEQKPPEAEPPEPQAYGKHWAIVTISQLSRIPADDSERQKKGLWRGERKTVGNDHTCMVANI